MEVMRLSDAAQIADRRTEIHVIPRDQQSTAIAAKARDRLAVLDGKPVTDIHGEEPHLIEIAQIERGQNRLRCAKRIAIPHRDVEDWLAVAQSYEGIRPPSPCPMAETNGSADAVTVETVHEPASRAADLADWRPTPIIGGLE